MRERELLRAVAEYIAEPEGGGKEAARERVAGILAELDPEKVRKRGLEDTVRQVLLELGVPRNLKGYERLVVALVLVAEDPTMLSGITKRLYPAVAERFGELWTRTERNVRVAVEAVFERNGAEVIDRYFGNTVHWEKGKVTNKAFLARVAGIVRKRAGMEEGYGM